MTIPELIQRVLSDIRRDFYRDRPDDFFRDELALTRAVARYGYECDQRGWQFDVGFILAELLTLLGEIRRTKADIQYLPVYLDGAVRRRIGLKSEELAAAARNVKLLPAKLVAGLKTVEAVREPTAAETLSILYRDLRRPKKKTLNRRGAEAQSQMTW